MVAYTKHLSLISLLGLLIPLTKYQHVLTLKYELVLFSSNSDLAGHTLSATRPNLIIAVTYMALSDKRGSTTEYKYFIATLYYTTSQQLV